MPRPTDLPNPSDSWTSIDQDTKSYTHRGENGGSEAQGITTIIGNPDLTDFFYPHIRMQRWNGECYVELQLQYNAGAFEESVEDLGDGKLIFTHADAQMRFYPLGEDELPGPNDALGQGGYEIDAVLASNPPQNRVRFDIVTHNCAIHYQPADQGPDAFVPDYVQGSYAVYATGDRRNHKYRTGKVCHLFRPIARDNNGDEVFCDYNDDAASSGVLEVTVPQQWLNNAAYPVVIDPTAGYSSQGASTQNIGAYGMQLGNASGTNDDSTGTLSKSGTVVERGCHAYIQKNVATSPNFRFGIYEDTGTLANDDKACESASVTISGSTSTLYLVSASAPGTMASGSAYRIGVCSDGSASDASVAYDSATGDSDSLTHSTFPLNSTLSGGTAGNNIRPSIWFQYTTATERIVYVDTDVSGGAGDGTSWANAYQYLKPAEEAERADLVTAGEKLVFLCRASSGSPDNSSPPNFAGGNWTVDEQHYIEIRSDTMPNGVWSSSNWRIERSYSSSVFSCTVPFTRLIGLQIFNTYNSTDLSRSMYLGPTASGDTTDFIEVDRCIVRADTGFTYYFSGTYMTIRVKNCLGYSNSTTRVIFHLDAGENTSDYYNLTAVGGTYGFIAPTANKAIARNCVSIDGITGGFSGTFHSSSSHNCSDNNDAPGSNAVNGEPTMQNKAGNDYRLASNDTVCKDAGVDLGTNLFGTFWVDEDCEGTVRPFGTDFDIGFSEYFASVQWELNRAQLTFWYVPTGVPSTSPLFDGKAIIADTTAPQVDGLAVIADTTAPDFDGLAIVKDTSSPDFDGLATVKDTSSPDFDGLAVIADTTAPDFDGLAVVSASTAESTLFDGLAVISDTAAPDFDGLAIIADTAAPDFDGLAVIRDTTAPDFDGLATVRDTSAPDFDGLATVSDTTAPDFDALAVIKDTTAPDFDGLAKIITSAAPLFDGLAVLKDTSAPDFDGLAVIESVGTEAPLFDGLATIKDTAAPLFDGLAKVIETAAPLFDGLATIKDTTAPDFDGLAVIESLGTEAPLFDGLATIADTTAPDFDGLAVISDTSAPDFDGLAVVMDSAAPDFDGLATVRDTTAPDFDALAVVRDTAAPQVDGLATIRDSSTSDFDGLAEIIKTGEASIAFDGLAVVRDTSAPDFDGYAKIQLTESTLFDGFAKVIDADAPELDGLAVIKDTADDIAFDGLAIVRSTESVQLDGLAVIKSSHAPDFDGRAEITSTSATVFAVEAVLTITTIIIAGEFEYFVDSHALPVLDVASTSNKVEVTSGIADDVITVQGRRLPTLLRRVQLHSLEAVLTYTPKSALIAALEVEITYSAYPEPTAAILTGRVRMLDMRSGDYLGQDLDVGGVPTLNTPSILTTSQEKDDIATMGFGYYPDDRAFTLTGQFAIEEILTRNSDFRWLMYAQFGHVPATDPGAARQFDSDVYALLNPNRALDTTGQPVVAFRQAGNPTAYWANYCFPNTGGENFNKTLLDQHLALYFNAMNAIEYRPIGIKMDYMNRKTDGPYPWDGVSIDFDQDGTGYPGVANNEADSFDAAQKYWIDQWRAEYGDDFILTGNGQGAWSNREPTLAVKFNGWYLEGFPTGPWSFNDEPHEMYQLLWDVYQSPTVYRECRGRIASAGMPFFHTDLRTQKGDATAPLDGMDYDYTMDSKRAYAGRIAALLFDGWWRHRPIDDAGDDQAFINDPIWDAMIAAAGTPTSAPQRGTAGSSISYSRSFTGGTYFIIFDPTATDPTNSPHNDTMCKLVSYAGPGI